MNLIHWNKEKEVSFDTVIPDTLTLTPKQLHLPHSFYPKPDSVLPAKIRSILGRNGKADENTFFSNCGQRNYSSVLATIKMRQAPRMEGFLHSLAKL